MIIVFQKLFPFVFNKIFGFDALTCQLQKENPLKMICKRLLTRPKEWSVDLVATRCVPGMVGLAPKWVRLAPNGTNPGLFQIRFQCQPTIPGTQ